MSLPFGFLNTQTPAAGLGLLIGRDGLDAFYKPAEIQTLLAALNGVVLRASADQAVRAARAQLSAGRSLSTETAARLGEVLVARLNQGGLHPGARAQLERARVLLDQTNILAEQQDRAQYAGRGFSGLASSGGLGLIGPRLSSCASQAALVAYFYAYTARYANAPAGGYVVPYTDSRQAAQEVRALCEANKPRAALERADALTYANGVEKLVNRSGKATYYVNAGDPYLPTILWTPGGTFRVAMGGWGPMVERGGYDGLATTLDLGGCGCGAGYGAAPTRYAQDTTPSFVSVTRAKAVAALRQMGALPRNGSYLPAMGREWDLTTAGGARISVINHGRSRDGKDVTLQAPLNLLEQAGLLTTPYALGLGAAPAAEAPLTLNAREYQIVGEALAPWHGGMADPLYGVMSHAIARRPIPRVFISGAVAQIERIIGGSGAFGQSALQATAKERAALKRALRILDAAA
jgi:hypothetical protein